VTQATPRLIDRADLLAALDRAAERKVAIISAPAGSGKTSLLRTWADRPGQPRRLAFVQVRRGQEDAQAFWLALLDAVRQASGGVGCQEPPEATPGFNAAAMADRVLCELACVPGGVTVVIEDLHDLNSPETLDHLTRVLTCLPAGAHAVLTTRHDLRLRLHRLRLAGELAEIRAKDLRFSEREARELLDGSGVTLSETGARLLYQRTEGWAAGLRLAALSLAGHPDPERFVTEFSGTERTVAEYLLAEMLDRQPGGVQDLLLRTCLLDRVNGELADLLTGRRGSERILLELEDANAFVVSLDPERTWFRFHHLFADLLRLELRRTLPVVVPMLHRRAAAWLSGHGHVIDAIRHTQAAGDWADAARLLADNALSMVLDGHAPIMRALVRAFPPGSDYPELALVRAGGDLCYGHLNEAAAHLAAAEAYIETAPPNRRHHLQVTTSCVKLWLARRRGNLADVMEQVRLLNSPVAGQSAEGIAPDSELNAVALLNLGTVEAWSVDPDATRHLREGAAMAHRIGRPYLEVSCLSQLGFASKVDPFQVNQQRCREAIALAERHGWGTEPMLAPALMTLGGSLIWVGRFEEGERWLLRAAQAAQTDTGPDIRLLLHHGMGTLQACRGRHREALEEFNDAESLQSRMAGSHALAGQVTGWRLATLARAGMPGEAAAALAEISDERAKMAEIANARAAICLAAGDPAEALSAVRDVLDGTAPAIGYVTLVEANLLAGLAHRALGDRRAASQAAERALALAEPDRLVLPFAITGSADLLKAVPSHETAHAALLTEILNVLDGAPRAVDDVIAATQATDLSPSELRVLRYLPTNLSRPEIATELCVSVNTVSTHIRSIYAKLQVRDRSSAVQRARLLQLLAAPRAQRPSPATPHPARRSGRGRHVSAPSSSDDR
jgi:LuxR family maltose regulon positive regulatory protein